MQVRIILKPGQSMCPTCSAERRSRTPLDVVSGQMVEVDGEKVNYFTSWGKTRSLPD